MKQKKSLPNSFNRVIFKTKNDEETKEMLNSYKFKKNKNKKKEWSPNINEKERFKKKIDREEKYMLNLKNKKKPILLVQKKKEIYTKKNPEFFKNLEQDYYKVSENTGLVEDIDDEINNMENFIRRKTMVQRKNLDNNLSSFYKFEGKEFLPSGFIELDSILLKDDYNFKSKMDEDIFREEQRKMKVLRRKQYQQKDDKKIRDVKIIFNIKEKGRIREFFDLWYKRKGRKLNLKEMNFLVSYLEVPEEKLKNLEKLFFDKQKLIELEKLKNRKSKSVTRFKDTPGESINRFRLKKENYKNVESRYFKDISPEKNAVKKKYLKKKLQRPLSQNYFEENLFGKNKKKGNLKFSKSYGKLNKNFSNHKVLNDKNYSNDVDHVFRKVNSKSTNEGLNSSQDSSVKNFDNNFLKENLEKYFDKDMSVLLRKIKNSNYFKSEDQDFLKKLKDKKEQEKNPKKEIILKEENNKSFSDDTSYYSKDSLVKTKEIVSKNNKNLNFQNEKNNETIKKKNSIIKKEKKEKFLNSEKKKL